MSDLEKTVEYDPNSLRNTLRMALGNQWTHELEDKLFWPVSLFCNNGCNRVREETLAKIRSSLGITNERYCDACRRWHKPGEHDDAK